LSPLGHYPQTPLFPSPPFPVLMTAICGQSGAKFQSKTWSINSVQIEQQPEKGVKKGKQF